MAGTISAQERASLVFQARVFALVAVWLMTSGPLAFNQSTLWNLFENKALSWWHGVFYNFLAFTSLFFYFRTMFSSPGEIPRDKAFDIREQGGKVRHCEHCNSTKPDRTHHCRICNVCVPKMDHHCTWTLNCVGFRNYKFYYLFLLYTVFQALVVITWILRPSLAFVWANGSKILSIREFNSDILMLYAFGCAVWVVIYLGNLLLRHTFFILTNITTIESKYKRLSPYDMGLRENIHQVFGPNPWLWGLPVFSASGDGFSFPTNGHSQDSGL